MLYENIITTIKDALNLRKLFLSFFIVLSITGLVLGLNWPKFYTSKATIFIEEENILGPLMRGAAVQTEVADRAKIAREIMYGRDILLALLGEGGWLENDPSPVQQERLLDSLRTRLKIEYDTKNNLLDFTYKDVDAERTFKILKKAVDMFVSESLASKLAESRSAFEFIDKQVKSYHNKLIEAEEELKVFRTDNVDIRSGSTQEITARIQLLKNKVTDIEQELRETKIKKTTLLAQLSGEAETAVGLSRAAEYRKRLAELQSQLDTLLLNYHDTYPDVIRTRNQMADLKSALKQEELDKQNGVSRNTITIEGVVVDERIQASPVYQQLRTDLYNTNSAIQTLTSRLTAAQQELIEQSSLGRRSHELQASLAELERDYNVNSDIYQDFLRRREAARVSMNVDIEQKGLNLRIDEPPFIPLRPSGLGLRHFLAAGFVLGLLLPFGILYGILQVDPRIRNAEQVHLISDVAIIGTVNEYYSNPALRKIRINYISIFLLGLLTVATVIAVAFYYR